MKDVRSELVRIDSRGEGHPIGAVASQRMRAREGAYRMLPSPQHVVFMRYTGEDGRRDDEDGAIVLLSGEITAPGTMCDVLALLAQALWRGELVVFDNESTRSIFFDQGNVVGVSTSVENERIGAVLYRYGALTAEQFDVVLEQVKQGKRFGQAAIQAGFLPQDQVYKYIARQIEEVVFATFTVGDGTFFFLHGFDEGRLVSRHAVSANALLMDGVTRMDEMRYFREKIPSSQYIPCRVEGRSPPGDEFQRVFGSVDGRSSIEDIGRATGLGEFDTTKQVFTLLQSKHVALHPPRMNGGPAALVVTANTALAIIHRSADAAGMAAEVRASLESFAAGAGVYDILFRGAGPDESGALDPDRVAENAVIVASGADPEQVLKQMLYEYCSFALFSAGSALGPARESELSREVGIRLGELRPLA
jgi:hypothetical protein